MPRANSSVPRHRRHRKIVKQAKGYYGARSRTFKSAKDAVVKAGLYAYRDRRQRKDSSVDYGLLVSMQRAAQRNNIFCLYKWSKIKGIELDRKILADMAVNDPQSFAKLTSSL